MVECGIPVCDVVLEGCTFFPRECDVAVLD
jgi:hypothetical protein